VRKEYVNEKLGKNNLYCSIAMYQADEFDYVLSRNEMMIETKKTQYLFLK
jgi:hypothetical protein